MASIALDADVIIAFLNAADDQHERAVNQLRPRLSAGDTIYVSSSVYAEVLVRPLQRGSDATVDSFIDGIDATIVTIDRRIARFAAELRARHRSLRLPDAFSIATALESGADLLTLDHGLRRIMMRERARNS